MTGQIGTFLKQVLADTHDVYGTTRNKQAVLPLVYCNLTCYDSVSKVIDWIQPEEIYNLAGETNSHNSILYPLETFDINGKAVLILCEKIKTVFDQTGKKIKLFQAASSELFKGEKEIIITPENTHFYPKTPYSIAKLAGYWAARYYREKYGLPIYIGIIFNTESPLRSEKYITKKVARTLVRQEILTVENLEARKNWLHAKDVASAIKLCLHGPPDQYVFSTGQTHTVRELIEISYAILGGEISWIENKGIDKHTGKTVVISAQTYRSFDNNEIVIGKDEKLVKLGWKVEYNLETIMRDIIANL